MPIRKSTIWLGSVLILSALLAQPAAVDAQCATASVMTSTGTSAGMNYIIVLKYLTGSPMCTFAAATMVIDCNPGLIVGAMATTSILSGTAFTTATNPSCSFNCDCGTITITGTDGLPVELMEFSVEDESEQDAEGARQEQGAAGEDEKAT